MGSFVQMGVQNFIGGLQQFQQNKANAAAAKRNAAYAQATAQAQASSANAQAKVAELQAGQAQRQAEVEANKRSRILAQDIGSIYANAAGNGLLVDGSGKETVGDVLKSTQNEAKFDIDTINENGAMNVWTYMQTAKVYKTNARNALYLGNLEAKAYKKQYRDYKVAAKQGIMQSISGIDSSVWSTLGVKSYTKFGGIFGSMVAGNPFTNAAGVYGLAKG